MIDPRYFVLVGLLSGAVTLGAGGMAVWKNSEIADLKTERAEGEAQRATAAVKQLRRSLDDMAKAASTNVDEAAALQKALGKLSKDVKNVKVPLPADCKPDAERMRILTEAVRAANDAATGRKSGRTVQGVK